ncbi:hypothetical protein MOMOMM089B2_16800 [Morganella morganii]
MSPDDFIRKNVISKLKEWGFQGGHWTLPLMRQLTITAGVRRQHAVAGCLMTVSA